MYSTNSKSGTEEPGHGDSAHVSVALTILLTNRFSGIIIIMHSLWMGGHGGIGRRTRFRIWRETVGVQVPLSAPEQPVDWMSAGCFSLSMLSVPFHGLVWEALLPKSLMHSENLEIKPFLYAISTGRSISRSAATDTSSGCSPEASMNRVTSSPGGGAVNSDMTGIAIHAKSELMIVTEISKYMK